MHAAAKLGSEIFERLRQAAVPGELIVGLILGFVVLLNQIGHSLNPCQASLSIHELSSA